MADGHMPRHQNRLLSMLRAEDYRQFAPELQRISLGLKEILYESDKPIRHVYFPVSGVMSMLAPVEEGGLVDVATVGNEGMVGLPLFLGATMTPGTCFSQVPGEALPMSGGFSQGDEQFSGFTRIVAKRHAGSHDSDFAGNRLQPRA